VIVTDVPIGAWTTALVFDALQLVSGRDDFATAADTSVTIGIAGVLCAAVTGVTDWQDADAPARRLGMIHGILNLSGTALFAASPISRKRKARKVGRILSMLGYGVMTAAARLGGKMVYEHRVGVDRTAGETFAPTSCQCWQNLNWQSPSRSAPSTMVFRSYWFGVERGSLLWLRRARISADHSRKACSAATPLSVPGTTRDSRWRMAGCSMGRLYTRNRVSKPVCATAALKFVSQFAKRL
jgi:uncharacterized membrane protein